MAKYITENVSFQLNLEGIKNKLDLYFLNYLSNLNMKVDARFLNALELIFKKSGLINVETDLDTGLSPRQMRRYFEYYIGDTAKTFSQVVRFQNILNAKPSSQSLRDNKFFFDLGYYDQAHFIKEFKKFYGVSPTKAFRR